LVLTEAAMLGFPAFFPFAMDTYFTSCLCCWTLFTYV